MYNVYLISSEIENSILYKIGYTKRDVNVRIKEFTTGNCSDLNIVSSFRSKWGTKIESSLHRMFESKRVKNEWFKLDVDDVLGFDNLCKTIHDNFDIIQELNTYVMDKGGL